MRKRKLFFCVFILFAFANISIAKDIPLLTPYIKTVNASGAIDILRNPALLSLQKEENNACIKLNVSLINSSQITNQILDGEVDGIVPPTLIRDRGHTPSPSFDAILGFSRNINDFFTTGIIVQQAYLTSIYRFQQYAGTDNDHINEEHRTVYDDYIIDISPGFSFKPSKYFSFGFSFVFQNTEEASLNEIIYPLNKNTFSEKNSRMLSLSASMGFLFNYGIHQTGLLFSSGNYSNFTSNFNNTLQSLDLINLDPVKTSVSQKFNYKKNFEVSLGHKVDISRLFSVAAEVGIIYGSTFTLPDKIIVNNKFNLTYFDAETKYTLNHQIPISASILFTPLNFLSFSISGMFKNSSSERELRTLNAATYYINTSEIMDSTRYSISPGILFSFAGGSSIMIAYSLDYTKHNHNIRTESITMIDYDPTAGQISTSINSDRYTLSILEHRINVAFVSDF